MPSFELKNNYMTYKAQIVMVRKKIIAGLYTFAIMNVNIRVKYMAGPRTCLKVSSRSLNSQNAFLDP